jgi:hypothetical protein
MNQSDMDYRMSTPFLRFLFVACLAAGTAAAQTPPPSVMAQAEQALAAARQNNAATLAPDAFARAEAVWSAAEAAAARGKHKEAERHALRARRLAEAAAAEARYLGLKERVEAKVSENAALRRELLVTGGERP